MSTMIDRMPLVREQDLVIARQKAREIAGMLGFDRQDQARIATAVSEIARNAIRYAHDGSIAYEVEGERAPQILLVRIADRGPGIANLDEILEGRYKSTTGMGIGLIGARRLMDRCEIASSPKGTTVLMRKLFDSRAQPVAAAGIERIRAALRTQRGTTQVDELQQQQQELLLALAGCARTGGAARAAQSRARGHESRRCRAVRGARRAGRPPAPRRRDEVALPVEHEP